MGCGLYDPAGYVSCVGPAAKSAAGDAFGSIAQSFGAAAGQSVKWLWGQMSTASALRLGGSGYSREVELTTEIAATVAVSLFVIQIIQSVLRREPAGLARALKGVAVAFLAGGAAIAVVNMLIGTTDALCDGVVKVTTGMSLTRLGGVVLGSGALTASVHGSAALLLLSLACISATVVVYGAVVVRKVLIVVTAVFAPIAFAGSAADISVSWTRRWVEATIALISSKLVLVLLFVTGYESLIRGGQTGSGATERLTQVISGIVVLLIAGSAPWMTLKIVHFTGEKARQLHPVATGATVVAAGGRMAQRAVPYVVRPPAAPPAGAVAGTATPGGGAPAAGGGAPAVGGTAGSVLRSVSTAAGAVLPPTVAGGATAGSASASGGTPATVEASADGTTAPATAGRSLGWPVKAAAVRDTTVTGAPAPVEIRSVPSRPRDRP
jgi:type IV secretion system protein TrbL